MNQLLACTEFSHKVSKREYYKVYLTYNGKRVQGSRTLNAFTGSKLKRVLADMQADADAGLWDYKVKALKDAEAAALEESILSQNTSAALARANQILEKVMVVLRPDYFGPGKYAYSHWTEAEYAERVQPGDQVVATLFPDKPLS